MTGEHRLAIRAPRSGSRLQQPPPCFVGIHADQITKDQWAQHRGHLVRRHILHPQWNKTVLSHAQHMDHSGRPFLGRVPGAVEIRRRHQCDHPVTPIQRIAHRHHEIPAHWPVPHIQLDGVPRLFQLPGRPLRPRAVRTGMTDEEILSVPTHSTSIPPSATPDASYLDSNPSGSTATSLRPPADMTGTLSWLGRRSAAERCRQFETNEPDRWPHGICTG